MLRLRSCLSSSFLMTNSLDEGPDFQLVGYKFCCYPAIDHPDSACAAN